MKISVGIVDDHQLFLKSLSLMLSGFEGFQVVLEALNGDEMQKILQKQKKIPDIILLDVFMPVMDGAATAKWLSANYPSIKLVALSMDDADNLIVNMIRSGCCAYLLKDTHPNELERALLEINQKGYYNSDSVNINYRRLLQNDSKESTITDKELQFLQLACSDLTYRQIAQSLEISERTIDGYREVLFNKLKVKSRVGLALECVRRGYFKL